MIWYVCRRADSTICATYSEPKPGLAEEMLDDQTSAELQAYFRSSQPDMANADRLDKTLKAVLLAAEIMSGDGKKADAKTAFREAWRAL